MDFLQEFFEDMDESVYISDPETYQIIYMNRKLRESLGFHTQEEYAGKKCYRILQGRDQPCSFCTNSSLQPGKFLSWTHKNSVLGKRFLIKDTMLEYLGRRYRIELAIDVNTDIVCSTPYYYARSESILNECLQQIYSTTNPEKSLNMLLAFIGKTFSCDRVYIFEFFGAFANNSYEWCREGVSSQISILQNVPLSNLDWWLHLFQENEIVTIPQLEDIRIRYPTIYAILKPQDISSLVAAPILIEGKVMGFLGVDNPTPEMLTMIGPLLKVLGYFIVALIRRRDLLKHLNALSFHDPLTGAYNRNALFEHAKKALPDLKSIGILYCDITGLKQTNDTLGHGAGDQLIQHCFDLIHYVLDTQWIYRLGGDEFLAVFRDVSKETFEEQTQKLQERISRDKHHIAVGCVWSAQPPFDLEALISQADKIMYEDKRAYYNSYHGLKRARARVPKALRVEEASKTDSMFYHFLGSTYHDMELLFRSLSQQNTSGYFYFGDMQQDLFYISDNLRDEFGFPSNIVPGLGRAWSQRIATEKERKMFWQDFRSMFEEKRVIHDLRYQVRNAQGKTLWVHCYGIMKWNEEQTTPLFFSGRITHQDDEFLVDPITNFPREAALHSHLSKAQKQPVLTIGFVFNNIAEINSTRGRTFSDHLSETIAEDLMEKFSDCLSFYRLDGMCFAAVQEPTCQESKITLVNRLRDTVSSWYHLMGVSVPRPCSFALMEYPRPGLTPAEFTEQLISLIRIAKHDLDQPFVEYSENNIQRVKRMSNMALALSRDVLNGMKHFRVVIQPIVSAKDGTIVGGETLLRWQFEDRDISPALFIPMLEKGNMIHTAGRWVFEQAVCTCMRLISYIPDFYLTFNVSLHQMSDQYFPEFMADVLAKYQVDGCHLVAEMTESSMDEQPEKLIRFIEACSKLNIPLALDDFGSGYSSLRMLLKYPSSIIKLDRSLLLEMSQSEDKLNFISSIVYACHRFGKKVCMEGVETQEQDQLIQEAGCDLIQGYRYYRPMEVNALYELMAEQKRNEI